MFAGRLTQVSSPGHLICWKSIYQVCGTMEGKVFADVETTLCRDDVGGKGGGGGGVLVVVVMLEVCLR